MARVGGYHATDPGSVACRMKPLEEYLEVEGYSDADEIEALSDDPQE